jgi:hypothetical protein
VEQPVTLCSLIKQRRPLMEIVRKLQEMKEEESRILRVPRHRLPDRRFGLKDRRSGLRDRRLGHDAGVLGTLSFQDRRSGQHDRRCGLGDRRSA